jgi:hypothetical protein
MKLVWTLILADGLIAGSTTYYGLYRWKTHPALRDQASDD